MTPEEKQIKLAEAAGWKWNAECDLAGTAFPECWSHDEYGMVFYAYALPNYFNDLNAIHELEKVLTAAQRWEFVLRLIAGQENSNYTINDWERFKHAQFKAPGTFPAVFATAAQRCEALGLTLNLWK